MPLAITNTRDFVRVPPPFQRCNLRMYVMLSHTTCTELNSVRARCPRSYEDRLIKRRARARWMRRDKRGQRRPTRHGGMIPPSPRRYHPCRSRYCCCVAPPQPTPHAKLDSFSNLFPSPCSDTHRSSSNRPPPSLNSPKTSLSFSVRFLFHPPFTASLSLFTPCSTLSLLAP